MFERIFSRTRFLFPLLLALFAVFLTGWLLVAAPRQGGAWLQAISVQSQQALTINTDTSTPRFLNGKLASLGWIVGHDCQRGMRAYLQTADTNSDAALVGTGWLDPQPVSSLTVKAITACPAASVWIMWCNWCIAKVAWPISR